MKKQWELQLENDALKVEIAELRSKVAAKGKGRKQEVLQLLKDNKVISINDIAKKLQISCKNVSSQLTYLRTDGFNICTDNKGRKFLMD